MAQYRPRHRKWTEHGNATPRVTKYPGDMPNISAVVAPYLPLARYSDHDRDYFVISAGTPLSLDSNNYLVPGGYQLDIAGGAGTGLIKYTSTDEDYGILSPAGTAVAEDDIVMDGLISSNITVSRPIGVAHESIYVNYSDDYLTPATKGVGPGGVLPTSSRFHNYKVQGRVQILMDYVFELPVVSNRSNIEFPGQAVFNTEAGTAPKPGDFVKINRYSDWVLADASTDSFFDVIGQVIDVDMRHPKGFQQYVQTVFSEDKYPTSFGDGDFDFTELDKMQGSATDGIDNIITYAGEDGTLGTVVVNLIRM